MPSVIMGRPSSEGRNSLGPVAEIARDRRAVEPAPYRSGCNAGQDYGATQFEQQVVLLPTVPPASAQRSADDLVLHLVPSKQSVLAAHDTSGSFSQVFVFRSQVPYTGTLQVTNPGLPHIERAAQRLILPLQLVGIWSLL